MALGQGAGTSTVVNSSQSTSSLSVNIPTATLTPTTSAATATATSPTTGEYGTEGIKTSSVKSVSSSAVVGGGDSNVSDGGNETTTPNNDNNNKNDADPAIAAGAVTNTNTNKKKAKKPREYNPRWKGYTYILVFSLVNFSAVNNVSQFTKVPVEEAKTTETTTTPSTASDTTSTMNKGSGSLWQVDESEYDYYDGNNSTNDDGMLYYGFPLYHGQYEVHLCFGVLSFTFAFLVLLADRTGFGIPTGNEESPVYNYMLLYDGKLEGLCLLLICIWWVIGVAYQTQVHGIAYVALNIYVSAWVTLGSCFYTLERWSASKDILSLDELTGISPTLRSWYVLFLSSIVICGTSINMLALSVETKSNYRNELIDEITSPASFGVAFGLISTLASAVFIMTHYNFIECVSEGGWTEIIIDMALIVLWIIGTAIITQYGGVGATVVGSPYEEIFVRNPVAPKAPTLTTTTTKGTVTITDNFYYNDNFQAATIDYISNGISLNDEYNNDNINSSTFNETDDWVGAADASTPYAINSDTCTLIFINNTNNSDNSTNIIKVSFPCNEFIPANSIRKQVTIPGSNLYIFVWLCLLSSLNIALRWKAQQALQLAQAQQQKQLALVEQEQKKQSKRNQRNQRQPASTATRKGTTKAATATTETSKRYPNSGGVGGSRDDDEEEEYNNNNNYSKNKNNLFTGRATLGVGGTAFNNNGIDDDDDDETSSYIDFYDTY